jgi:RNB domain
MISLYRSCLADPALVVVPSVSRLQAMHAVSSARRDHRTAAGAQDIPSIECQVFVSNLDPENHGTEGSSEPDITVRPILMHQSPARQAVMEMMVLAGEIGAKWAASRGVPVLFRCEAVLRAPALCRSTCCALSPDRKCLAQAREPDDHILYQP